MRRITTIRLVPAVAIVIGVLMAPRAGARSGSVTFVDNGPHGSSESGAAPGRSPQAGAINAIVAHPTNPDVLWIGAVNGGVWKTTTATHVSPIWVPLTDHEASLSIGALALDPTDATHKVLVAGIGGAGVRQSSYGINGPRTGLLRTTDGGDNWQPLGNAELHGKTVTGVAPRGNVIVVATDSGLWRTEKGGAHFDPVTNTLLFCAGRKLTMHNVTDLVGDPVHTDILYAAILGGAPQRGTTNPSGVFFSTDTGRSWCEISNAGTFDHPGGTDLTAGLIRISLAVYDDGTHEALYAGLLYSDKAILLRTADRGTSWTRMQNPDILSGGPDVRFLSIQADPTSPTIVYVGGDGRGGAGGLIFRCDAARPREQQCVSIARERTGDNSAPHGDSRALQFDARGTLLDANDGGISRRSEPRSDAGVWTTLDGNLSVTETHSCSWDHVAHVAICGAQDTGVLLQPSAGAEVWTNVHGGDGGNVAVSESHGVSTRYYSAEKLAGFSRTVCHGLMCDTSTPSLKVVETNKALNIANDQTIQFYTPMAAHPLHPERLVITTNWVYESDDAGNTLRQLDGWIGTPPRSRTIAFGSADHPDFLYVGSSRGIYSHKTKFGPMLQLRTYPGKEPKGLSVARTDSGTLLVVDSDSVWETGDAGTTWSNLTFDLKTAAGAGGFSTVSFVERSSGFVIFVGASDGLYAMTTTHFGHWFKLHGKLPNAIVYDLEYDRTDDLLLVSTIGRGTWTIASPGSIEPSAGQ